MNRLQQGVHHCAGDFRDAIGYQPNASCQICLYGKLTALNYEKKFNKFKEKRL